MREERFEVVKSLMSCKPKEGVSICAFVLEMKRYIDRLKMLNVKIDKELAIDMVFNSLPSSFNHEKRTSFYMIS